MAEFKPIPDRKNFKNLSGQRIRNQITVLGYIGQKGCGKRSAAYWLCQCDCGKIWEVSTGSLANVIRSCGCLTRRRVHGMYRSKEFRAWKAMKQRCCNKNSKKFHCYGARGIDVCDEWLNDFQKFYADMGSCPTPEHSIDRIDNDGPYAPWNCRWATASEQASNKSNNRLFEIDGVTKTLMEWCRHFDIREPTVHQRLSKGWSVTDAFTRPPKKQTPPLVIPDGVDIPRHVIGDRLRKGWTFERAISYPWTPQPRRASDQP